MVIVHSTSNSIHSKRSNFDHHIRIWRRLSKFTYHPLVSSSPPFPSKLSAKYTTVPRWAMRRTPTNYALIFLGSLVACVYLWVHWPFGEGGTPVWLTVFLFDGGHLKAATEYAEYVPRVGNSELESRLRSLLDAPLESYASALSINEAPGACPRDQADRQAIKDQLQRHSKWWSNISTGELARRRLDIVRYLEDIAISRGNVIGRPGGGRGIVMTGGNKVCRAI